MARMKWNAATGRFETPRDNGFENTPVGATYIDTVTGEAKIRNAGTQPDTVVRQAPAKTTNTTAAPKPASTTKAGSTTSTTMAPKTGVSPTTTVPKTTTTTPTTVPPTPTGPSAEALRRAGINVPTAVDTALNPPTNNDALIAAINAQSAIMAKSGSGSGTKTPTAAELAAKYQANINAAKIQEQAGATAQTQYNTIGQNAYNSAVNTATPMYAGQTADVNKYYDTQTGTTNTNYDAQLAAMQKYYTGQGAQASKTINDAGTNFLAGLPDATAFANAQVANLPQIQQGLGDALAAYGATGNKAQEVSTQDAAYLDAIAKMQTSANAQLSAADKAYMASLKTAGQGANTAAQQALAGNLAGLQAQDTSGINAARRGDLSAIDTARRGEIGTIQQNQFGASSDAEALRQSYISKGIEALMSGKQTAAATKAQAAADYGVPPKKAKSKKTTKK